MPNKGRKKEKYENKLRTLRQNIQKQPEKIFDNLGEKYYNANRRCENYDRTHIAHAAKSEKKQFFKG